VNQTPALWSAQARMSDVAGRQLVIDRAQGNYVTTADGRRLFDGTAGLWHANIGHGREEMAQVAYEQIQRLETYHIFGRYLNDRAVELAEKLAALSPVENPKVILNSGGSDSIDVACKLARRHFTLQGRPEKNMIVSREFAYHGLHAYGTSIAGLDFNREGYGSDSLVPETARVSRDDIGAVEESLHRIGPGRIAAIIAEPVMGTGGVYPPEPGYFEGLGRLAREHDILVIADEVITGFGRTGTMFASTRYDIEPDIITFAKGVTSGYAPLGGIFVAPAVWEPFFAGAEAPIFRHGSTYAGHATAAALALKNLEILEREDLVRQAGRLEEVLAEQLAALAGHEAISETRVGGFLGGIELTGQVRAEAVTDGLVDRGFITRPLRGNTVQISPPFTATEDEVRSLAGAIRAELDESLAGIQSRRLHV
jgi:adenosylmethionine-8-amino-7-oxononanoate aminotransferase